MLESVSLNKSNNTYLRNVRGLLKLSRSVTNEMTYYQLTRYNSKGVLLDRSFLPFSTTKPKTKLFLLTLGSAYTDLYQF